MRQTGIWVPSGSEVKSAKLHIIIVVAYSEHPVKEFMHYRLVNQSNREEQTVKEIMVIGYLVFC